MLYLIKILIKICLFLYLNFTSYSILFQFILIVFNKLHVYEHIYIDFLSIMNNTIKILIIKKGEFYGKL